MIRVIIIEHMKTYAVHSQLPEPLCQQFAVIFRQKTGSSGDVGPVKADRDSPVIDKMSVLDPDETMRPCGFPVETAEIDPAVLRDRKNRQFKNPPSRC